LNVVSIGTTLKCVKRAVALSPAAARQFRKLKAHERAMLRHALTERLSREDATQEDRNRFRLRRPSEAAEFELRVEDLRVFYRVRGAQVQVVLIGRKKGGVLLIDSQRFKL